MLMRVPAQTPSSTEIHMQMDEFVDEWSDSVAICCRRKISNWNEFDKRPMLTASASIFIYFDLQLTASQVVSLSIVFTPWCHRPQGRDTYSAASHGWKMKWKTTDNWQATWWHKRFAFQLLDISHRLTQSQSISQSKLTETECKQIPC